MTSQKNIKAEKRANALRDNLKRRKLKEKAENTAPQKQENPNPSDKT